MEINTLWKGDVVTQTIKNVFMNILGERQSHPKRTSNMQILLARYRYYGVFLFNWSYCVRRFEFLQVCGSKLLKPLMFPSLTDAQVKRFRNKMRQGDVYIRPRYEFSITESEVSAKRMLLVKHFCHSE